MNTQTRPALDSDYQWLLELHHIVYRDLITQEFGYWNEDEELGLFMETWESKPIEILMLDDKPAGMSIVDEYTDQWWLDEIQIHPRYQHQGIGTEVIEQLIVRARTHHLSLRLRVLHTNQGAYRLYLKSNSIRLIE